MTVRWSICVAPVDDLEHPWMLEGEHEVLRTASVGKILLLAHTAERIRSGSLDPRAPVTRAPEDFIRDSGLWHTLDEDTLGVADVCRLIGATSDNLATNALLRTVGLDQVKDCAARLDAAPMELCDKVRGHRDIRENPRAADTLSKGSAHALWRMQVAIHDGRVDPLVGEWLSLCTDLSMVASAFDLDPLAHNTLGGEEHDWVLVNKTGTDDGVRADTGLVTRAGRTVAYAAMANWEPAEDDEVVLRDVMSRMHAIGTQIRTHLTSDPPHG